jgi:hypothetical protein
LVRVPGKPRVELDMADAPTARLIPFERASQRLGAQIGRGAGKSQGIGLGDR